MSQTLLTQHFIQANKKEDAPHTRSCLIFHFACDQQIYSLILEVLNYMPVATSLETQIARQHKHPILTDK